MPGNTKHKPRNSRYPDLVLEKQMIIREATVWDLPQLLKMGQQLWPDATQSELETSFSITFTSPKEITFISEQDYAPIGFAICTLRSDYVEGATQVPVGYLEAIFVNEEFRGTGLAQSLVLEGENWCKAQGCTQMASDTEITNLLSERFHQKIGFKECNRIVCFIKEID